MRLVDLPVTAAEMFESVRRVRADHGTTADHICAACRAVVLLRYGRHQDKYAVSGRHSCPWCWSQSWYDTTETAWAAFEKQQRRYLQQQAINQERNTQ